VRPGAGRWLAIAIELVVHKPAEAPEALTDALTDALGRLLVAARFSTPPAATAPASDARSQSPSRAMRLPASGLR
jgi:hypothetical protein